MKSVNKRGVYHIYCPEVKLNLKDDILLSRWGTERLLFNCKDVNASLGTIPSRQVLTSLINLRKKEPISQSDHSNP